MCTPVCTVLRSPVISTVLYCFQDISFVGNIYENFPDPGRKDPVNIDSDKIKVNIIFIRIIIIIIIVIIIIIRWTAA